MRPWCSSQILFFILSAVEMRIRVTATRHFFQYSSLCQPLSFPSSSASLFVFPESCVQFFLRQSNISSLTASLGKTFLPGELESLVTIHTRFQVCVIYCNVCLLQSTSVESRKYMRSVNQRVSNVQKNVSYNGMLMPQFPTHVQVALFGSVTKATMK